MFNNPLFTSALVLVLTVLINVGLAYSGQTQKLSCTLQQTAAVVMAVQTASSTPE